jgi:hypothetical protein
MWRLEFLPADDHLWISSLPLGGYSMLDESFDSSRAAREVAGMLREVWPDLQVRVVETEE